MLGMVLGTRDIQINNEPKPNSPPGQCNQYNFMSRNEKGKYIRSILSEDIWGKFKDRL